LKVLKEIRSVGELGKYIDYLRSVNPDHPDHPEYLLLKEFMRFSPEKFAREVDKNEIQFSKEINNIKGELNKKLKHVIRIKKMNSILPEVGLYEFSPRYGLPPGTITRLKVVKLHCIAIQDSVVNLYRPLKFFRGVIYSYFTFENRYYLFHRDKPGGFTVELESQNGEFFKKNFVDMREWKIDQIMYSVSN
jgi:hypothetical protein